MGTAASTKQLQKEAQRPIDASDIKGDLADAKKEITRLRTLIKEESEKLINENKGRVQSVTVRCLPEEGAEGKTGNVVAVANAEKGGLAECEDGATCVQQAESNEGKGGEAPQPLEASSQHQDNSQTPAANDAAIEAEEGSPAQVSTQDETPPDDAGPKDESKDGGATAPSAETATGDADSCPSGEADSKAGQNPEVLKAGSTAVTAVEGSHDMKAEAVNAVAAAAS